MGRIFAIGGGEIRDRETESIDRRVREATGEDSPAALFVPTASGDAAGYCDTFDAYYGDHLGCRTRHLTLHDGEIARDRIRTDVEWADLVYVGGGSTPLLVDRWRETGADRILREAFEAGTVLAGLSAGATCWFESGLADAGDDAEYAGVECLGWVDGIAVTPHASPLRRAAFREYLATRPEAGLALEDGCAVELRDDEFRILSATGDETAYGYRHREGTIRVTEIDEKDEFSDVETLA